MVESILLVLMKMPMPVLHTAMSVSATLYTLTRAYLVNITQESTDKLGVQYSEKDKTYPDVK